jgi:hypothetical protein
VLIHDSSSRFRKRQVCFVWQKIPVNVESSFGRAESCGIQEGARRDTTQLRGYILFHGEVSNAVLYPEYLVIWSEALPSLGENKNHNLLSS